MSTSTTVERSSESGATPRATLSHSAAFLDQATVGPGPAGLSSQAAAQRPSAALGVADMLRDFVHHRDPDEMVLYGPGFCDWGIKREVRTQISKLLGKRTPTRTSSLRGRPSRTPRPSYRDAQGGGGCPPARARLRMRRDEHARVHPHCDRRHHAVHGGGGAPFPRLDAADAMHRRPRDALRQQRLLVGWAQGVGAV